VLDVRRFRRIDMPLKHLKDDPRRGLDRLNPLQPRLYLL
jgi:hypothetical protein